MTLYNGLYILLEENENKLEKMVKELSVAMYGVKREQEYMEVRERIHRGSEFFLKTYL